MKEKFITRLDNFIKLMVYTINFLLIICRSQSNPKSFCPSFNTFWAERDPRVLSEQSKMLRVAGRKLTSLSWRSAQLSPAAAYLSSNPINGIDSCDNPTKSVSSPLHLSSTSAFLHQIVGKPFDLSLVGFHLTYHLALFLFFDMRQLGGLVKVRNLEF